jgi:undecaprenyl-diphosphatase
MSWDINLFNFIHGLSGWSVFTDATGIFFARYLAYLLGLAAVYFVFRGSGWKSKVEKSLYFALAILISRGIIAEVVRYFYDRPRPFAVFGFEPLVDQTGASFPSGHAALFFAIGFMIFSLNRKWGYWFLSLAFLNGLARIFIGVHYPSDILGGILAGFLGYLAVRFLLIKNDKKRSLQEVQPEAGPGN